jgi:hypothetical protein
MHDQSVFFLNRSIAEGGLNLLKYAALFTQKQTPRRVSVQAMGQLDLWSSLDHPHHFHHASIYRATTVDRESPVVY